jgi:hypothetical protein
VPRFVTELGIGFQAPERGQDIFEAPAGVPARRPGIEVRRGTAHGETGQPRGAPEEPAASQLARRTRLVCLGFELPIRQRRQSPPIAPVWRDPAPDVGARFE